MNNLILVTFVCLFALSCERKPQTSPLGPQVSIGAIKALQNEYISRLDPYSINLGQKVHMAQTQEVISTQTPAKSLSKEWVTEVTQVENFPETRIITTLKKVNDKLLDDQFTYEFKNVYHLQQIETLTLLDQLNQNSYEPHVFLEKIQQTNNTASVTVDGVAFHNLQTRIVTLTPPPLVSESEGCGGLTDCKINADLMTYDIVFLMSDGSTQKTGVEWYISSDVPFFAGILKQCATSLVPVENVRVLVKQCSEVVDFQESP